MAEGTESGARRWELANYKFETAVSIAKEVFNSSLKEEIFYNHC